MRVILSGKGVRECGEVKGKGGGVQSVYWILAKGHAGFLLERVCTYLHNFLMGWRHQREEEIIIQDLADSHEHAFEHIESLELQRIQQIKFILVFFVDRGGSLRLGWDLLLAAKMWFLPRHGSVVLWFWVSFPFLNLFLISFLFLFLIFLQGEGRG